MNGSKLKKITLAAAGTLALAPYAALAQFDGARSMLDDVAGNQGAGYDTSNNLMAIIGTIIKTAIGLTGIVFLGLTLFAGYKWMMAQGNPKEIDAAKDTIKAAVIGLIVVVLAYAITAFVFNQLGNLGQPANTSNTISI